MPISQGGYVYPFDATGGMGDDVQATTVSDYGVFAGDNVNPSAGNTDAATFTNASTVTPKTSTLWYVAGIVILLVILKYGSEHEKSGLEPKIVGIGVWNFATVGIMAILFILVIKTILNKYSVPGLTDIINAV